VSHNKVTSQLRLTVSAVIARLRIPARLLAELGAASCIEIEPYDATAPILTFEVQNHTVARGYTNEADGMTLAKIFSIGCEPAERPFDQWILRRKLATGDATDDPGGNNQTD
jgi:hypothetical protein